MKIQQKDLTTKEMKRLGKKKHQYLLNIPKKAMKFAGWKKGTVLTVTTRTVHGIPQLTIKEKQEPKDSDYNAVTL